MSDISWFGFENKDRDFPFYKKNPHVPKWGWIVLFIAMIFGLILTAGDTIQITFLSCVVIIVPVLYFLKWDYKAIFQKPSLRDVALALALCAGYLAYALIISTLLENVGIMGADLVEQSTVSIFEVIPLIFSLMTEEFLKFIPFMFFLRLIFKYSDNRKLSVVSSMLITMVFFASLHSLSWGTFIYAIFVQGFGSIFEFFAYFKTKNILVSYICHYATDFLLYMCVIFGF